MRDYNSFIICRFIIGTVNAITYQIPFILGYSPYFSFAINSINNIDKGDKDEQDQNLKLDVSPSSPYINDRDIESSMS